jgi:hypothetical protein
MSVVGSLFVLAGLYEIGGGIVESCRRRLAAALESLTDEEVLAFLKGLKTVTECFGAAPGEEN